MKELADLIVYSPGEVRGFLDKFKSAGLGAEVNSWLGRSDGAALTGPQVERALGNTALGGIASRLGLGSGVVATAIGYILPKLIGQITPGGVIPSGIPASLSGFLQSTPIQTTTRRVEQASVGQVTPHPREHYVWGIKLVMALLLVIFLVVSMTFEVPRLFKGTEVVSAATVLGVSIAFTGVLVPCVFLVLSRRRVVSEMLDGLTDIQSELERGRFHGLAIRQRSQTSEVRLGETGPTGKTGPV
jgi:hypothetical protein